MASIRIKNKGATAEIYVDGKKVPGVRGYSIEHKAGELPIVQLDLVGTDLTFDGDLVIPALPEVFKPFYEIKTMRILPEESIVR